MNGDNMVDNSVYWDQYSLSSVKPTISSLTGDNANALDDSIFEPVTFDGHIPDTNITSEEFWKIVAKNPNKTVKDYHENFNHNMPLPVLHEGELVYSFDGSQIYYNILNQIIQMDERDIHYDHPILLKLVMDNIQIFERHWRKMVVDIRTGLLDRRLLVPQQTRLAFEAANLPRPRHAQQLDNAFRQLGFHKKVLGKDIQIKEYAERRTAKDISESTARNVQHAEKELQQAVDSQWQSERRLNSPSTLTKRELLMRRLQTPRQVSLSNEKSLLNLPLAAQELVDHNVIRVPTGGVKQNIFRVSEHEIKRKNSLPFEPSEAAIISMSRPPSSLALAETTRVAESDLLPIRVSTARSRAISAAIDKPNGDFSSPRRVGTSSGKTKRELLQDLGHKFFDQKETLKTDLDKSNKGHFSATVVDQMGARTLEMELSTSRTGTGLVKRRKSQSEMQRPVTSDELQITNYDLVTAPRDSSTMFEPTKLNEELYVCPFPACGCTFFSRDAARRHMPIHSQRLRLYAASPQSDSHMNFYWPTDVPWLKNLKYTEKTLPPGSVRCTEPGCPEIFATFSKLEAHMRLIHQHIHPSNISLGYGKFERNYRAVPPDPAPEDFNILCCRLHATPVRRCPICMEIETKDGPKPPFYLHESLTIDFQAKGASLLMSMSAAEVKGMKKNGEIIRLHQRDHKYLLMIANDPKEADAENSTTEYKARAIFLLVDRNKIGYLGVEPMYSMDDLIVKQLPLPFKYTDKTNHRPGSKKYELFPARTVEGVVTASISGSYCKMSPENVVWTPLHMVRRVYQLLYIKDTQFVHSNAGNPLDNLLDNVDQVPIGAYFTTTEP
jgi:hypothetical protein